MRARARVLWNQLAPHTPHAGAALPDGQAGEERPARPLSPGKYSTPKEQPLKNFAATPPPMAGLGRHAGDSRGDYEAGRRRPCLKPVIPADMMPRHPPVACSKMVLREQVSLSLTANSRVHRLLKRCRSRTDKSKCVL